MAGRKLTVYKEFTAQLVQFETDYGSIVIDCSDKAGMKSAKDCRKEIRDVRSNLEDLRKETKAPVLLKAAQIDKEAKDIKLRLDVLFNKFDTSIKAIENKAEIAKQKQLDDALAKVTELEDREAAILAKEIELGLREAPAIGADDSADLDDTSSDSGSSAYDVLTDIVDCANASTICEPHIKAASERLVSLKKIRSLVQETDEQKADSIDEEIARNHDEVLGQIWNLVDEYK